MILDVCDEAARSAETRTVKRFPHLDFIMGLWKDDLYHSLVDFSK